MSRCNSKPAHDSKCGRNIGVDVRLTMDEAKELLAVIGPDPEWRGVLHRAKKRLEGAIDRAERQMPATAQI